MFVDHKFYVGLRDINKLKELKNTSLLSYLEDVASMHSEIAGYGVTTMNETKKTWVLLSWKVKIIKRPKFNDTINVKTWSRGIDKFYAYRDFEVYNKQEELIAIATSKWVFVDIEKKKIIKVADEISEKYKLEKDSKVFEEYDLPKFTSPKRELNKMEYKITNNMIDINNHLHNIYYMDIADSVLSENNNESNNFEIIYKKEIKLGETVKAIYSKEENYEYVTIKSNDENTIHSIIRLK